MPEQRMQRKIPMFHDAQRGCLLRLQSAQDLLASSLTSCFSVARFCSVRSGPAGGRRDMIAERSDGIRGSGLVDVTDRAIRSETTDWFQMYAVAISLKAGYRTVAVNPSRMADAVELRVYSDKEIGRAERDSPTYSAPYQFTTQYISITNLLCYLHVLIKSTLIEARRGHYGAVLRL